VAVCCTSGQAKGRHLVLLHSTVLFITLVAPIFYVRCFHFIFRQMILKTKESLKEYVQYHFLPVLFQCFKSGKPAQGLRKDRMSPPACASLARRP